MNKKAFCTVLLVSSLLFTAAGCRQGVPETTDAAVATVPATDTEGEAAAQSLVVPIRDVNKHGNLILETTFDELNAAGIAVGDIITVAVGDRSYDMPVGTSYTDVDAGSMLCRFDQEDSEVALAVNMGSFAEKTDAAEKQTIEADPGYQWNVKCPEVTLSLKEKQGYLDQYNARNLARTNERADYPALTDEAFANFRAVAVTGIKENTLYRSSSPIDEDIGRNEYAMAAMEAAGIRSVVNLANGEEALEGYAAYPGSYYSQCDVLSLEMGYDYASEEFAEQIKDSVLFLTAHKGPYLIHCKEGKDRTGILCAVLECFAGASAEEVTEDYMITYRNYYGVQQADVSYDVIRNDNLVKTLCGLFGVDSLEDADLKESAARYLLSVGLSEAQLDTLRERIVTA